VDQLVLALPLHEDGRSILDAARSAASSLSHPYIGTEHFIAAFDDDRTSAGTELIARAGGDVAAARARVAEFLTRRDGGQPSIFPGWTPRSVRAINLAVAEAAAQQRSDVSSDLLAVGVIADGEGLGAQALASTGVSLNGAKAALGTPST
jgi:ATP-dependent Clp protease ATP-binding subunit ClpC